RSSICPTTTPPGEPVVVGMCTGRGLTTTCSAGSLLAVLTGALAESPPFSLHDALPISATGVKLPEGYTALPATGTVLVNTGAPVQEGLAGQNRAKVMVPVGLAPPARVALSETWPPITTPGDAVVVSVGVVNVTTTCSAG